MAVKRPKKSCLAVTATVKKLVVTAVAGECVAKWDHDAGTVEVFDGEECILRAIQKGSGSAPWIVMFYETNRIKWGTSK